MTSIADELVAKERLDERRAMILTVATQINVARGEQTIDGYGINYLAKKYDIESPDKRDKDFEMMIEAKYRAEKANYLIEECATWDF